MFFKCFVAFPFRIFRSILPHFSYFSELWNIYFYQFFEDSEERAAQELREQMLVLEQLRKEREILASETEELRKTVAEVCHAAIVIQKSFRKFHSKKKLQEETKSTE